LNEDIKRRIARIVAENVGGQYKGREVPDDLRLVGNILDSMAVTSLIVALEENFGIVFEDEDLSAEAFENVPALADLVRKKLAP
jgi:acyl carrier protein